MMDTYHTIEEKIVFPPTLIDEVYDFKSFLNGYIKEGKDALVPVIFMFSTSNSLYLMVFQ